MYMFRSMTAYGRAHITTDVGLFLIEIHSVNRKNLDITVNLPKELLKFDIELRKELAKEIKRGCVTVRITCEEKREHLGIAMPDIAAMQAFHKTCHKYAKALGYSPNEAVPFHLLLHYGLSWNVPSDPITDEGMHIQLMNGFKKALGEFILMREREGTSLLEDIDPRLTAIEQQLDVIVRRSSAAPEKFRKRLEKRLQELDVLKGEDEERMARELVIFAEKVDVTEEITRLRSHLQQFREMLQSKKSRIGRELDFLIQEMNREVNTTAAKSQDLEITQAILEMKAEQEKIREQVQNIE